MAGCVNDVRVVCDDESYDNIRIDAVTRTRIVPSSRTAK